MMSAKVFGKIVKSFYPPLFVFCGDVLLGHVFHLYRIWPSFDIPMHFAGGFSMGITAILLMRIASEEKWLDVKSKWILLFIAVCFTSLTATVWEFAEWTSDHIFFTFMQAGLNDTMLDMFLGVLGGFVSSILLILKKYFHF